MEKALITGVIRQDGSYLAEFLLEKDYELHGELKGAEYIDRKGLFIGNHHYPIVDAIEALQQVQSFGS
jgi:GDP-D-mannose dehydratase